MNNVTFTVALEHMKAGEVVITPTGNYLFLDANKVYCIPKNQFPNGRREDIKVFWDAILSDNWQLTCPTYIVSENNSIKAIQS